MKSFKRAAIMGFGLGFSPWLLAETGSPEAPKIAEAPKSVEAAVSTQSEQEKLAAENKLAAEKLTNETNTLRAEIARMKLEREAITERLALESAKRDESIKEVVAKMELERDQITREGELAKAKANVMRARSRVVQAQKSVARAKSELAVARTGVPTAEANLEAAAATRRYRDKAHKRVEYLRGYRNLQKFGSGAGTSFFRRASPLPASYTHLRRTARSPARVRRAGDLEGHALAYLPTLSALAMVPPMISSWSSLGRSSTTSL